MVLGFATDVLICDVPAKKKGALRCHPSLLKYEFDLTEGIKSLLMSRRLMPHLNIGCHARSLQIFINWKVITFQQCDN